MTSPRHDTRLVSRADFVKAGSRLALSVPLYGNAPQIDHLFGSEFPLPEK